MVKPFRRRSRQARPACGEGKGGAGEGGQAARPAAETRASRSAGGGPQGIAGGQLRAPEGMAAP